MMRSEFHAEIHALVDAFPKREQEFIQRQWNSDSRDRFTGAERTAMSRAHANLCRAFEVVHFGGKT